MASFVIAYVPQVEQVDYIDTLHQVDNVSNVELVQDVRQIHSIVPHFPLKRYNYQYGGSLHVEPSVNIYSAVYTPNCDCEFKGVNLCFTSYNVEDTYNVRIGSKYIIQNSHVKEMTEYRVLENYEIVPAGTPIVIEFSNKSGLEKFMLYDLITLIDEVKILTNVIDWTFDWQGANIQLGEQDTLALLISQPDYVNLQSSIKSFVMTMIDPLTGNQWNILCNPSGVISSNYTEPNGSQYTGLNLLGRSGVIGVISVTRYSKTIQVIFKNLNNSGTVDPHSVEIGIHSSVTNIINGGI
jgi:hypothetical protein